MADHDFPLPFTHPLSHQEAYSRPVAYFSMEFAIDQALKTYSGGLGFLAGSHMRSAFRLRQHLVGIGILWKYGYYDQDRSRDNSMTAVFREKPYFFLTDTKIRFRIVIEGREVWVHTYYLRPGTFGTAPVFFLTTDTEGNDEEARSISYRLYHEDAAQKIAQCILLGIGGARLLDALQYPAEVYHLNEAHALPAAFYLYNKLKNMEEVRKRLVFTTHTPEEAGNEIHDTGLLSRAGFFDGADPQTVQEITGQNVLFNHTLAALRLSRKANGVSGLHGEVARRMWNGFPGICDITHITNAQNREYWADRELAQALQDNDPELAARRKKVLKQNLFTIVANQTGRLFDPEVLTIVWARRFAGYKRPDLLIRDKPRFERLMNDPGRPIQFIWAGKPYPKDLSAIHTFNGLHYLSYFFPNMAVLTGYELALSKALKDGADLWLNTPVVTREASGTSGMTAAMNAAINCSTFDGWIPEFARHGENAFIVPPVTTGEVDDQDMNHLFDLLENEVIPCYYEDRQRWNRMAMQGMQDASGRFDSDRMAREYYEKLYTG